MTNVELSSDRSVLTVLGDPSGPGDRGVRRVSVSAVRPDAAVVGSESPRSDVESARRHFHAIWLRDGCGCAECRRPGTNERLVDSTRLDLDISIVSIVPVDEPGAAGESMQAGASREAGGTVVGVVDIEFSDGHTRRCHVDDLLAFAPEVVDRRHDPFGDRTPWKPGRLIEFDDASLPDAALELCDALWMQGVVLIRSVDPTEAGMLDVAGFIGNVLASNYGPIWSIEASPTTGDSVNSQIGMRVHTDLPYRELPPGLQMNMCVVSDVAGGASTFVDGYSMAELLRHSDPRAWDLLTTTRFLYPYRRGGTELDDGGPLIGLRPDGSYGVMRRAPGLVGSPIVAADDTVELFAAVRVWSRLVDDVGNQSSIRLEPGDLAVFDNHRMLHGRTSFELGPDQRRHLLGCYLELDELRNRRALLRRADRG